jgi:uncharacterized integral membrane protein (TIGR00698 family)
MQAARSTSLQFESISRPRGELFCWTLPGTASTMRLSVCFIYAAWAVPFSINKFATPAAICALPILVYLGNPAVALLVGAAITLCFNAVPIPAAGRWGKYALQTAIVLLGLKLNPSRLVEISIEYSGLVSAYVLVTLSVGLIVGWVLRNERKSSQLLASGTAICGGTTIASLSPVIQARADQTAVALSLVFLLNAIALFTFPTIGHYFEMTQYQFGVWTALAIHDTSSVMATSSIYGEEAAMVATTLKLGRTLWLIPLILVFSIIEGADRARLRIPLFIIGFVLAAAVSPLFAGSAVISGAALLSKALLCVALFCIGLEINRATLSQMRGAALLQGVLLWLLVVPITLYLVLHLA